VIAFLVIPIAVPFPEPMGDVRITEEGDRRITEDSAIRHTQENTDEPVES